MEAKSISPECGAEFRAVAGQDIVNGSCQSQDSEQRQTVQSLTLATVTLMRGPLSDVLNKHCTTIGGLLSSPVTVRYGQREGGNAPC